MRTPRTASRSPLKPSAYSMPGVTIDGTDPQAVYAAVGTAVEARAQRCRPDAGRNRRSTAFQPTATSSAPPGVPLHYPEHEAITVFGKREEYEAALRGDPVPRFRATLVTSGVLNAAKADELSVQVAQGNGGGGGLRRQESLPQARVRTRQCLRLSRSNTHGTTSLYRRHRCRHSSGNARDSSVLYFGQNMATTENHEFVAAYGHDRVRVTPISEDGGDRNGHRRGDGGPAPRG